MEDVVHVKTQEQWDIVLKSLDCTYYNNYRVHRSQSGISLMDGCYCHIQWFKNEGGYNIIAFTTWCKAKKMSPTTVKAIKTRKPKEVKEERFKTEAEFIKEFGHEWRSAIIYGWNKDMDILFGKPKKTTCGWTTSAAMFTTKALPKVTKPAVKKKPAAKKTTSKERFKTEKEFIDEFGAAAKQSTSIVQASEGFNELVIPVRKEAKQTRIIELKENDKLVY